ncbi:MAG TPA: Ig-like domain-containing protein, partial [Allosphingosinicella sp.]
MANTPPVTNDDVASTTENAPVTISPLENDFDADGDDLTISAANVRGGQTFGDPPQVGTPGSITVSADGTQITYDPGADFDYLAPGETATVLIDYRAQDTSGAETTQNPNYSTITVTVTGTGATIVGGGSFDSIQEAINNANDGDTIVVYPGTYAEDLVINKDITLQGANAGTPGTGARGAETILDGGILVTAAGVTIDGFKIVGDIAQDGFEQGIAVRANDFTLVNSVLEGDIAENPAYAILTGTVTGLDINNNLFSGYSSGIYVSGGGSEGSISENYFDGGTEADGGLGGGVVSETTGVLIDSNTFDGLYGGSINLAPFTADTVDLNDFVTGNTFPNPSTEGNPIQVYPGDGKAHNITGTDGAETYNGDFATDGLPQTIDAGGGNDRIYGGAGNDDYSGGAGDDEIYGGAGDDSIDGGEGDDYIDGGPGNDSVDGGDGEDVIVVTGNPEDFTIETEDGVTTITNEDTGEVDTLEGVETVQFVDEDGEVISTQDLNERPVTMDDTAGGNEDSTVTITPLTNDSDANNDELTISRYNIRGLSQAESVAEGLTLSADGKTLSFDLNEGYDQLAAGETEVVLIDYRATDGELESDPYSTITFTVTGVNDAPVTGGDDTASGSENDASITGTVPEATDVDNGDSVTYALVPGSVMVDGVAADDDTVTLNPDGSYSYTPIDQSLDDSETRTITFDYVANDGDANSEAATVTITETGANDAPVTGGDGTASGSEDDSSITGTVPEATDVDSGDTVTYELVPGSVMVDGETVDDDTVTLNPDGTYTYTPIDQSVPAGDSRIITFDYVATDGDADSEPATITITETGTNEAPTTVDDVAETTENNTVTISPLVNDSDPDEGDTLTISAANVRAGQTFGDPPQVGAPGSITISADGTQITYDPGTDFDYLAAGETATVLIDYRAKDSSGAEPNQNPPYSTITVTVTGTNDAPVAMDDTLTDVAEDSGARIIPASDLLGNDTDLDASDDLVITAVSNAVGGTAVLNPDGSVTFTPTADFNGPASFDYTVSDGNGGTDTGTASFNVTAVNDAPVAMDDTLTDVAEDSGPRNIPASDLLTNDSDVDGDTLAVTAVSNAVGGTVVLNGDGSVTFTPTANFNGPASFDYTVSDGNGGTDTGTASFNVTPVNDPPTTNDDVAATTEN